MSIAAQQKTAWNDLPQGVVPLFCIQIFSTLSYSVLYSTLVLFMTGQLGMSAMVANSVTGVFVAFNYALHLLGGYLGGRFFSYRALFSLGMLAQIVGCVLLSKVNTDTLYFGLGAFLSGCGLNVTCINCMLTQRFKPTDSRRESAFLFNYAGMNIGFFIGFSLSGYYQLLHNYQRLFLLSSVGNLMALLICLYFWNTLGEKKETMDAPKRQLTLQGLAIVLSLPLILSQLLQFANIASKLVLFTGVSMLFVALYLAKQQQTVKAKEKIQAFTLLMVVGTVFWTLFQIGPMGLTSFIENNVQRNWVFVTIPPQWFQNINTICIVLGGPLLSVVFKRMRARGIDVNIPTQFSMALVLIGFAFAILPIGIARAGADGLVSPFWVILSFVLQSFGELLISPIGYAMIGALAPHSLQGVMMGMWMLMSGVGATLSSYSSNLMTAGINSVHPTLTNAGYSRVFFYLGLFAILSGLLLSVFIPMMRRLMSEEKKTATANKSPLAALQ